MLKLILVEYESYIILYHSFHAVFVAPLFILNVCDPNQFHYLFYFMHHCHTALFFFTIRSLRPQSGPTTSAYPHAFQLLTVRSLRPQSGPAISAYPHAFQLLTARSLRPRSESATSAYPHAFQLLTVRSLRPQPE